MIKFPVFSELEVKNYGLYPGDPNGDADLTSEFLPGLTLVLGANGLGKTTLVAILLRLLTGPFDIPGLQQGSELGTVRLEPKKLSKAALSTFADRVTDGASNASARLGFTIGDDEFIVERKLSNLQLTAFSIDGKDQPLDETEFQSKISKNVGVWSFGDWILLLRHLVFYFEDRRALVWDHSAQRQILRSLFFSPQTARKWTEDEREILKKDSAIRNTSATLTRMQVQLAVEQSKMEVGDDVRTELEAIQGLHETDSEKRDELASQLVGLNARREDMRLRLLRAEQSLEDRSRELERAKLLAIESRFPDRSETARYILAQLMAENVCLVCDSNAPKAAQQYEDRITKGLCVVCGTNLESVSTTEGEIDLAERRLEALIEDVEKLRTEVDSERILLAEAENSYSEVELELIEIDAGMAKRAARIDYLTRQLPPEEQDLLEQKKDLAALRSRLISDEATLEKLRNEFTKFVNRRLRTIAESSETIKGHFDDYAKELLFEDCQLAWSPHRARVGQTGAQIEFPSFDVDMTGSDFSERVRRSGPEQVSESQREFIDLSFRMALMKVAGNGTPCSIVIDAPEASLDAVFVEQAASVLATFALPKEGNRLLLTSNLVDGELIPELLRSATTEKDREERVIDLLKIAEPTAALRERREQYEKKRDELIFEQGSSKSS